MRTTINLNADSLAKVGITIDQFQKVASDALSALKHPETGETLYFSDIRVTVIADCPEISTRSTGHAAGVTSLSQAGIELHADRLSPTSNYAISASQPTCKFDAAAQSNDLVGHSVSIGKTADVHMGLAESYQQMGVTAAEFVALQPKP